MMQALTADPVVIMLMINALLLIVGCFMESLAAITVLTPILLPVALGVGVHPVQFGIIMVLNLMIGLLTPPLGMVRLRGGQGRGKFNGSGYQSDKSLLHPAVALPIGGERLPLVDFGTTPTFQGIKIPTGRRTTILCGYPPSHFSHSRSTARTFTCTVFMIG